MQKGGGVLSLDTPSLVGRNVELVLIENTIEECLRGAFSVPLVKGDPGIGRARIAQELCTGARTRDARR